jgi:3-oxoacyl-[acyl-carrier protein] reductase
VGLTKSIAKEMGPKGITANALAPGFIQTDMTQILPDQVKQMAMAATPLKRLGVADEVAAAAAFLASEEAGFITGQVLAVDGGMTMC